AFTFETSDKQYYGFPSINGTGLKLGRHDGGETINPEANIAECEEDEEDAVDVKQFLNQYMHSKKHLKYGKKCMYTRSRDGNFIIDMHSDYSNVAIAAVFSGHGFKFSSVVGKVVSDLITEGQTQQNISPFSLRRFRHF